MTANEVAELIGAMDVAFGPAYRVDPAALAREASEAWQGLSAQSVRAVIRTLDGQGGKRPSPGRVAALVRERQDYARQKAAASRTPDAAPAEVAWYVTGEDADGPIVRLMAPWEAQAKDLVPLHKLPEVRCPDPACRCAALEVALSAAWGSTNATVRRLQPQRWAWEHVLLRRPSWALVDQPMRRAA